MRRSKGYTLIETMMVVGIIGIGGALAYPAYSGHVEDMKMVEARKDLVLTDLKIETYFATNGAFPANLAAVGMDQDDPWGSPYQYLNMDLVNGNGLKRQDASNEVINTDYDLYSNGPDSQTNKFLTHTKSVDDIVRGNNGAFVGVATDY
jgi:general secretion pathway protein G